jgi:hypothetical protein
MNIRFLIALPSQVGTNKYICHQSIFGRASWPEACTLRTRLEVRKNNGRTADGAEDQRLKESIYCTDRDQQAHILLNMEEILTFIFNLFSFSFFSYFYLYLLKFLNYFFKNFSVGGLFYLSCLFLISLSDCKLWLQHPSPQ